MRKRMQLAAGLVAAVVAGTVAGSALMPAGAQAPRSVPLAAADEASKRIVTGVGIGRVRGVPDVLTLTLGVDSRARTASEALTRNNERARQVIAILRDAGVDSKDIQTSNLWLMPIYDDDGISIDGYAVSNTVTAQIRDLSKAGDVIDAASAAGGEDIVVQGLTFDIEDDSKLIATARAEAVRRARAQAEQLAEAAGVKLGEILSISESSSPSFPPIYFGQRDLAAEAAPNAAPIEPGTEELEVQVTIVFEIG